MEGRRQTDEGGSPLRVQGTSLPVLSCICVSDIAQFSNITQICLKQLISHAESMYQIFGVSAIFQINVLSGDSKIIKLNKLLLQSNLKLKMSTLIGQQTNMNTSIAHRAGSPGNDCPHDGGELHPGVPRPAWEIPGAAPGGGVGSK